MVVETYYISDANDATDTDGGFLAEGSTTYRIWVDMAAGYEIQAVYGNADHTLSINTTTEFFNNEDRGEETGDAIGDNRWDDNTVAVDSWVTLGASTDAHLGVFKADDGDGSLGNSDGFMANNDAAAGVPILTTDGQIPGTLPSGIVAVGLDLGMFADANSNTQFSANGGAWSVLEGVQGPTGDNYVLVAQITTTGDLSFELNVQLGAPDGSVEQWVASNPIDDEMTIPQLTFPVAAVDGCTSATACNYDAAATNDDGSCIEPVAGCTECNATNDGLDLVDADGDGVCDNDDQCPGFDDALLGTACDDGDACTTGDIYTGCAICEGTFADADGDGVCDADDQCPGFDDNLLGTSCDDGDACTINDIYVACDTCAGTFQDTDGDGVCDADEGPGCTSPTACNYDPTVDAGNDDGSCIEPVADCSECNGAVLQIIDTDGDGICDADEVPGCTDAAADNYDASATDDDGSCSYGAVFACDGAEGGLEDIVVETYYIADANDATDTDGGGDLVEGATTYRVYVDLAPGYEIQAVYGNADHTMSIATSTEFFNNEDRGEETGDAISDNRFDDNTVALDSYVTLGAPTDGHLAVLKSEDGDGAVANSDGFLQNDFGDGFPVNAFDGMIPGTLPSGIVTVGIDLSMLADANSSVPFSANGGAWSVLEGVTGPTAANRVLVAQITTDGDLSFQLNVQLGAPDGSVEQWVASNPLAGERLCGNLIYPGVPGCTSATACNYDPAATVDDASCEEPVAGCTQCNGSALELIDADSDGVCDNDDQCPGFDDNLLGTACDDGDACTTGDIYTGCAVCEGTFADADGDGVCDADDQCPGFDDNLLGTSCDDGDACTINDVYVGCDTCAGTFQDTDGDGVCDADEYMGCTSATACNYDPIVDAANDDGSCIEPIANCQECNATNDGLVIVDTDGDGICDADELGGCTSATACNYDPAATDDDGSCVEPIANCLECDPLDDTNLILVDTDGDGTCDADENPGCNNPAACNYDPAATGDDGSCLVPVADCTECSEIYGTGEFELVIIDTDGDGTCDADEVPGCMSLTACNYDPAATESAPELCIEPIPGCYECNATNDGLDIIDSDGDGICDGEEVPGCTSMTACNYDPAATDDDGSCFEPVADCLECSPGGSVVLVDADGDGVCDAEEVPGCMSDTACNYDPAATDDDGSCLEPIDDCYVCNATNDGLIIIDADGDGICNAYEIPGCQSETACNYDPTATDDDGSCIDPTEDCMECFYLSGNDSWILIMIDTDGDGICDANEVPGCTSATACNYDAAATDDDGSCIEPVADCSECNATNDGLDIIDSDGDGICDADEVPGCTSATACNYDPTATDDDGSCLEPVDDCLVCWNDGMHWQLVLVDSDGDGVCDADDFCDGNDASGDTDGDGICDDSEIPGCTSPTACNYDPTATDDDWSCLEPVADCVECNATNDGLVLIDSDGDGICDANEIDGCTSASACNYDPAATDDDGSCIEPTANCMECNATNDGLVMVDTDGDGICDAQEVDGCTSATACNYDPAATDDDGSCLEPVADCYECNGNGLVLIDSDGDGVCDAEEVDGCTSPSACNYDAAATEDDGSCIEPVADCFECIPGTGNGVIVDTDGDGICDADEVPGCTSATACNYDPTATDDDGSCIEPVADCLECYTTSGDLTYLVSIDSDGDGICDADEVPGCTDAGANNYDPAATDNDGSCEYDCYTTPHCEGFESGVSWYQSTDDDIDWSWNTGSTPSFYTGPESASEGDYYIYIEASYPNYPSKSAVITSNCYTVAGDVAISFDYHMQGVYNAVGSLELQGSADGGASWMILWSASGHQGTDWNSTTIAFNVTGDVKFRFIGTTANSWKGDIAVDNFCVSDAISGCTDPTAGNYDPTATVDDGSCTSFSCSATQTPGYCEDFEAGFGDWFNSAADDFDWLHNTGGTASWGTGPSAGSDGTASYLYAEASYPNYPFKNAYLMSPCFDLSGASDPHASFDYHMHGTYVGSIYLQVSTDGTSWDYLWWETGAQGDAWNTADVDLIAYAGQTVQLRIIGMTAHGWQGDLAIDEFCLNDFPIPAATGGNTLLTDVDREKLPILQGRDAFAHFDLQEDEFATTSFFMYPNPANNASYVNIEMHDVEADVEVVMITVRDLVGKIVFTDQLTVSGSQVYEVLELNADLATGTYLVTAKAGSQVLTDKLMVTK